MGQAQQFVTCTPLGFYAKQAEDEAMAAEMAVRAVRAAKRAECCARACKGRDGLWAHLYPWCARRRAARIVPARLLTVGVVGLIA